MIVWREVGILRGIRNLFKMSKDNIEYKYILVDSWFGAKANLEYINDYLDELTILIRNSL